MKSLLKRANTFVLFFTVIIVLFIFVNIIASTNSNYQKPKLISKNNSSKDINYPKPYYVSPIEKSETQILETINDDYIYTEALVTSDYTSSSSSKLVETKIPPLVNTSPENIVALEALSPKLSIKKSLLIDNFLVNQNQILTYRLEFTNSGNQEAVNTLIQDNIDPNSTYIEDSCTYITTPCKYNEATGSIEWKIDTVPANQKNNLVLEYRVKVNKEAMGVLFNLVFITSDNDQIGGWDAVVTPIKNIDSVELFIQKTLLSKQLSVSENQILTYKIEINNNGEAVSTENLIRDFLSDNEKYIENSCTYNELSEGSTCGEDNNVVYWDIPEIVGGGQSSVLTYKTKVSSKASGRLESVVYITSKEDEIGVWDELSLPVIPEIKSSSSSVSSNSFNSSNSANLSSSTSLSSLSSVSSSSSTSSSTSSSSSFSSNKSLSSSSSKPDQEKICIEGCQN